MNLRHVLIAGASAGMIVCGTAGCVKVDTDLGHDYMPLEQQYDVYTQEWDLEDISMQPLTHMSAYSTRRFTIGSIRVPGFGTTNKGTAFALVPVVDTMDFGTNPVIREFHFSAMRDTVNVVNDNQTDILQNVNVYSMDGLDVTLNDIYYTEELNNSMFAGKKRITRGVPVYDGGDSLSFKFSDEFGQSYLDKFVSLADEDGVYYMDSVANYIKDFPGIYICTDEEIGTGGRIDMFDVAMLIEDGYVAGNYAELKFTTTYDGEKKDTSLLFLFGAVEVPESSDDMPDQYAFNVTEIKDGCTEGAAADVLYVEGGNGMKPVFSAKEIWTKIHTELEANSHGIPDSLIALNKVSITLPFDFPSDYKYMSAYPEILNPCCRIKGYTDDGEAGYTYANLTDASISDESHGEVDRSNCQYSADISFHSQALLKNLAADTPDSTFNNYDVWFIISATEVDESSSSSSSSDYSDYLNQLYYYNYLNQLYGGYGSYGYSGYGYGSYGSSYSNYYSMLYYSSLYSSSSSSSTSTSEELDRDRFYGATLHGPTSSGAKPKLTLTYSVPKREFSWED